MLGLPRLLAFSIVFLVLILGPSLSSAGTSTLNISAQGANGTGVSVVGSPCADGGTGSFWQYQYSATLDPGTFSSLASTLTFELDLHSETQGSAWMAAGSNSVVLTNARGSLTLSLFSGSCIDNSLAFDGSITSGSGTWSVESGSGSYRDATGSGTFNLTAQVEAGNGNLFDLDLHGSVAVYNPDAAIEVVRASWEPGSKRDFRTAIVTFRVENIGPGDAFDVEVQDTTTSTPGAVPVTSVPVALGDIAAGENALVELRYQLDKETCRGNPRCQFDVSLSLNMSDALDVVSLHTEMVEVGVPTR